MEKVWVLVLSCFIIGLASSESSIDDAETSKQDEQLEEVAEESGSDRASAFAYSQPLGRPNPFPAPSPSPILVECHACTDCPTVSADTPSKLCPPSLDPNKQGKCVTYSENYRHMKRPWFIRGCASERGTCDDIRRAHANHANIVQLRGCHECEGERCNTNGAVSVSDMTIAFVTLIVTPLIAKLTLS
ncbi:unnamed protein product [Leptidea sinapis]|uniref:Protein quiver n=1 Tax=Leptidea sinapis TaxID=189913 RepID=A0A5E4PY85_9NEOP|nr:unnamed protein product [Leptidea sinapis]